MKVLGEADTEGQGHQRKVAWTVIFVSGLDKPQAEWKKSHQAWSAARSGGGTLESALS